MSGTKESDATGAEALGADALFVVLDGVDGCGKTTQAQRLVAALEAAGRRPLHLREPGSTVAGERIRELVLDPEVRLGPGALALLFTAARRQTLEDLVRPALAEGRDVVVERFHASTFAYQGTESPGGPGLDRDALLGLLGEWAGDPRPTVEVVLDLSPDEAYARAAAREGGTRDRFEARGLAFQERVSGAMRDYVARLPHAVLVDAVGDEAEVARRVLHAVGEAARERG